jgi:hypothetical protein
VAFAATPFDAGGIDARAVAVHAGNDFNGVNSSLGVDEGVVDGDEVDHGVGHGHVSVVYSILLPLQ